MEMSNRYFDDLAETERLRQLAIESGNVIIMSSQQDETKALIASSLMEKGVQIVDVPPQPTLDERVAATLLEIEKNKSLEPPKVRYFWDSNKHGTYNVGRNKMKAARKLQKKMMKRVNRESKNYSIVDDFGDVS